MTIKGAGCFATTLLVTNAFNSDGVIKLAGPGGPPTVVQDLAVVAQNGGAGAVSVGVNSATNGVFLRNLWVTGFKTNVILGSSDNFLLDSAIEEAISAGTAVNVTSPDVTIADCVIYNCYVGIAVSAVAFLDSPISITNVRTTACLYTGFLINASSNVQLTNCSAGHNNVGRYTFAGLYVTGSSNIIVDNFIARLGSGPSTTAPGIYAADSSNIIVSNSQVFGFMDGIVGANCVGLTLANNQCKSNGRRGIYVNAGDQVVISGNNSSSNGGAGSTDAGIYTDNSVGSALYLITGNMCMQGGSGPQEHGIYANVTNNGVVTGFTIIVGNLCKYNGTNITTAGVTANISQTGNVT
jgi:parallel beta-helix repeat protein